MHTDRLTHPSPQASETQALLQTTDLQVQGLRGRVRLVLTREEVRAVHAYLALWPHTLICHGTGPEHAASPVYKSAIPCTEADLSERMTDRTADGTIAAIERAERPGPADCLLVLSRRQAASLKAEGPELQEAEAPNALPACGEAAVCYLLEQDPTAPDGQRQEETLAAALCSLGIALVAHWCMAQGTLSMHGALLAMPSAGDADDAGGLLLLGANRGGKSSLCVRLMARGLRTLGDDMLGLDTEGTFLSLGLAPRLRIPLPPSPVLRDFAFGHAGAGDERAFFLQPDPRYLEPFAGRYQARRIRQILILERMPKELCQQPSAQARTPADTLTELVGRFFMQEGSAPDVLDAACHLAETVPCATFRYADLDEAADLLWNLLQRPSQEDENEAGQGLFFDGWEEEMLPAPGRACDDASDAGAEYGLNAENEEAEEARADALSLPDGEEDEDAPDPDYESSKILGTQEYCRCTGVLLEQRLGIHFLVNPDRDGIHVLNETGRIIWQLLGDPLSLDEACLLLEEVYLQTDPACIARDLQKLFADLLDAGLIRPC